MAVTIGSAEETRQMAACALLGHRLRDEWGAMLAVLLRGSDEAARLEFLSLAADMTREIDGWWTRREENDCAYPF